MGCGSNYSQAEYDAAYASRGYAKKSGSELFEKTARHDTQTSSFNIHARKHNTDVRPEMLSVGVRESRNSSNHPHVDSFFFGLDNTGSMTWIPEDIIKHQFPKLMNGLKEIGIKDPQLLFMAVGDHFSDNYPCQVSQFECETEKILDTVQHLYLEGNGGGNGGESYLLAWIMAGYHTELDCWYKDHRKGFLFTIGDEPTHMRISGTDLTKVLGYERGAKDITAKEALKKAQEQYEVFHIYTKGGCHPESEVRPGWEELLGDHFLVADGKNVNKVILETIHKYYTPLEETEESPTESVTEVGVITTPKEEEKEPPLRVL